MFMCSCWTTMNLCLILFVFKIQTLFIRVRGNEEDVVQFFTSALQCIESLQEDSSNFSQERLYRVLEDHTQTLSAFLAVSRDDYHVSNTRITVKMLSQLAVWPWGQAKIYWCDQQFDTSNNLDWPWYSITTKQISHCVPWYDMAKNCIMFRNHSV